MTLAAALANPTAAAPVACLSGFVRDSAGHPVVGGDLDFFDFETGVKLSVSGDKTDRYGFYNVCVPPARYRVTFAPPPGTRLLGEELPEVDLGTNGRELDVVLEEGRIVAGVVLTADGAPLGGVDVNVDRSSGGRLFTPYDKTDPATGAYAVVVPDGVYRFRFTPPQGARWQGVQLASVAITGDQTLDVTLPPGVLLYGRVADEADHPLGGVELDLRRRPDGAKVFVVNGSTGANGDYTATVPPGAFEVRAVPPSGSRQVAARIDSTTIDGDTRLDLVLPAGILANAVAVDSAGAPVAGAALEIVEETTGAKPFLPRDKTDANGLAVLAVPPGRYSFRFDPPSGTALDGVVFPGVSVARDTVITARMPELGWARVTGRVVDTAGSGVPGTTLRVSAVPGDDAGLAAAAATDADGTFELALPRRAVALHVAPPHGSRLAPRCLFPVTVTGDSAFGDIVLEPGIRVTVRVTDSAASPVAGAALRVVASDSGTEVYTPGARTDASGIALVALSPGRYDATVTPPAGAGIASATMAGVEARADTTIAFVLHGAEDAGPQLAAFRSLAPNPFGRSLEIGVRVRAPARVSIDLYDAAGRFVRRLENAERPPSVFTCAWDGCRADGSPAPSGVYFVILRAPGVTESRKILLVR